MSFKDIWTDIIDGVSEIRGEDLNNIAHEVLDLIDDAKIINNEIVDIKFCATDHESRLSTVESNLAEHDNDIATLKTQVDDIGNRLENTENLAVDNNNAIANLQSKVDEIDADIIALQEQVGNIDVALDSIIAIQNELMGVSK